MAFSVYILRSNEESEAVIAEISCHFLSSGKHVSEINTPYIPLLYSKTGVCRGVFLIFAPLNKDCGYSLEPPRRGGSNVYPQSMF